MDVNVQAFRLVQEATAEPSAEKLRRKAASKRGGLMGGKARAQAPHPEERKAIAQRANQVRWSRVKEAVV